MKQLFISVLLVLSSCTIATAQEDARQQVDSLLSELAISKADTNRCSILSDLAYYYQQIDIDSTAYYAGKCVQSSQKISWERGIANGHYYFAQYYAAKELFDSSIFCYEKTKDIYIKLGVKNSLATTMVNLGICYYSISNLSAAIEAFQEAAKIFTAIDMRSNTAVCYQNIGAMYIDLKDYAQALKYQYKSLDINKELGDESKIADNYLNIGAVYGLLDSLDQALAYSHMALDIETKVGDKKDIVTLKMNIGIFYLGQKKFGVAKNYINSSVEMAHKEDLTWQLAEAVSGKSQLYLKMANADRNKYNIAESRNFCLTSTIKYAKDAIEIWNKLGNFSKQIDCYRYMYEAHSMSGHYKSALDAHVQYITLKDSLFSKENTDKIARIEVKAEYEKKQLADSIQNVEAQKLADVKLSRQKTFTYGGIGAAILLLAFSVFVFRNNKKLGIEKEKSEELLYNILPEEVAYELKERGATTAQQFDHVTVLFTDFVNFTQAGEQMGSQALVEELHNCFEAFDGIMDKYGIEKIKTIGDAYLAVCGLPTTDERHAEKVVQAAQDIRGFMVDRYTQLGDKTFEVRIGVHSGEVVAGIVGVKKFAYDIWGDTVNTAARMESKSEAGKINISQSTYELVQDKFTCTYRGEIEAKGKGKLKMYFVEGVS